MRLSGVNTFLVHNFVRGCLPILLVEDLDGDNVPLYCAVHVLSADEQHWFLEAGDRHTSLQTSSAAGSGNWRILTHLEIVVLIGVEVALMQLAGLHTCQESCHRQVLRQGKL